MDKHYLNSFRKNKNFNLINNLTDECKKTLNIVSNFCISENIGNIVLAKQILDFINKENYGVFIHWGIYSIPAFNPKRKTIKKSGIYNGSEWYIQRVKNTFLYGYDTLNYHTEQYGPFSNKQDIIKSYYNLIPDFEKKATSLDVKYLINIIKQSGAKYVYITAKHHDGVSLYPTNFGMYHTNRDYIDEIRKEAINSGLKFGIYYSLLEWTPLYTTGKKKIEKYVDETMFPQIYEIMEKYNPDVLWVDGDWNHTPEVFKTEQILDKLFNKYPNLITNDRWGKNFWTWFKTLPDNKQKFYLTRIYKTGQDRLMKANGLWEHVNTISNSWGYAKNQTDGDYKNVETLKKLYNDIVSNGGKFTLNIGPKPDGSLDPREEKSLNNFYI